jgi:hypothetical protein
MATDAQRGRMPRATRSGLKVLAVGLLVLGVALPVLYVASIGPAAMLVGWGWIDVDNWRRAYEPVRLVKGHNQYLDSAMREYMRAWGAYPIEGIDEDGFEVWFAW